jgi:hypothetical protein
MYFIYLIGMKKNIAVLILMSVLFSGPILGQVDSLDSKYAVKDTQVVKVTLFDTDNLFEISLKFDISAYKKAKSDTTYLNAILTYFNNEKDSVSKRIKVKARGNIRRTEICDFPPLMLNFKLKDQVGTEFAGINKLKVVPYCNVGFEQYILKEFLIYKLYNIVTDFSYRVRLFRISYINSAKEKQPVTQYGFALEPLKLLEKRTNSVEITYSGVTQRIVKQEMLDRMAIFNYMIGNTDWSVPARHNIVLLASKEAAPPNNNLIIPFDFDYAGLVGAAYAVPFETLPIKRVQERLYVAVCRTEDEFRNTLNEFLEKKDQFYKVINDFPYLNAKSKKTMIGYLDQFFNGIEKKDFILKKILSDCMWFEKQANLRVR